MKYMLMMNTMRAGQTMPGWTTEDLQAHITFMHELNRELREAGEFILAEGLSFPNEAKLVRAGEGGLPNTDGIFPESKEFLAGFWILNVANAERVYQIAARISAAPGRGGSPLNMPIEVRPVPSAPPAKIP